MINVAFLFIQAWDQHYSHSKSSGGTGDLPDSVLSAQCSLLILCNVMGSEDSVENWNFRRYSETSEDTLEFLKIH